MDLDPYSEIIGILHKINKERSGLKAIFLIQKEIYLPINPDVLGAYTGKRIKIFSNNGKYIIKEDEF